MPIMGSRLLDFKGLAAVFEGNYLYIVRVRLIIMQCEVGKEEQ